MEEKIHKNPYYGTNNRKRTLGRLKLINRTQSVPIFKEDANGEYFNKETGKREKLIGYKYIEH